MLSDRAFAWCGEALDLLKSNLETSAQTITRPFTALKVEDNCPYLLHRMSLQAHSPTRAQTQ